MLKTKQWRIKLWLGVVVVQETSGLLILSVWSSEPFYKYDLWPLIILNCEFTYRKQWPEPLFGAFVKGEVRVHAT